LKIINEHLSILFHNQTISPRFLARKSNIEYKTILKMLTELSSRKLLGVKFIVQCENDDLDMIHAFEFESETDLINFINKQDQNCPYCNSKLNTKNIRVAFIKKDFENQKGEYYG
jgi:hypothetical protein